MLVRGKPLPPPPPVPVLSSPLEIGLDPQITARRVIPHDNYKKEVWYYTENEEEKGIHCPSRVAD